MRLKGEHFGQLRDALLDAFKFESLRSMVRIELDADLEEMVSRGTFKEQAEELILWAERNQRIEELIAGARKTNPGNKKLQDAAADILESVDDHRTVPNAIEHDGPRYATTPGSTRLITNYHYRTWRKPRDAFGILYVVGTGKIKLAPTEVWISKEIGKALAQISCVLITGGWPGVDHVVAEAFLRELKNIPMKPVSKYLLQIVEKGRTPDFKEGGSLSTDADSDFEATGIRLSMANALIAIGGMGGVRDICEIALSDEIPVFPIANTDGDAKNVYDYIVNHWNESAVKKDLKADFERILNLPIDSEADATALTNQLMELMIENHEGLT